ncbi:MAG: GAF domain-containing protein [Chloroflexi bacterium]|nr:GAF domain-containing protein [Chloroflexota bacterium]
MDDSGTQKIRVLFADADAAFCVFARYSLEQLGFEITLANNGADLVARFLPEVCDVVVVGLATPFFDGMQVLRAIKQRRPATPVILLCDDDCAHLAEQGMQEGAFAYFQKPLNDFAPLSDAITRAHTRQAAPPPAAALPAPAADPFAESLYALVESTRVEPLSVSLQIVAKTGAQLIQAPSAIVLLAHAAGFQVFSASGFANLETASRDLATRVGDAFGARVIAERRAVSEPLPDDPAASIALGIPIQTAEQTLGALILYPLAPTSIDPARLAELQVLAAHAALAIEFARLREENLRLISSDPTTGVLKREPFLELADREFRRSWRYNQPITALIVDIDDLAAINHKHGHSFGNQVLRAAADVCVNVVRSIDLVGRYESDAFALLLLMTGNDGAQSVAERLRVELAALRLPTTQGAIQVTATIGVCSYPRDSCTSIFDLLALAHEAQRAARIKSSMVEMSDSLKLIPSDDPFANNLPEPPTLPETLSVRDLSARLQRRYADLVAMYTASARLDATREERELHREILATAQHLTRTHGGSLMLRDETNGDLVIAASNNLSDQIIETTRVKIGEGVAGWVTAYAQPLLLIGGITTAKYPKAFPKPNAIGSSICAPLVLLNSEKDTAECLGVLNLNRVIYSPGLTEEDLHLATAFCASAAIVIHNARLCKVMKRRAQHLEHLIEINRHLSNSLRLDDVLQSVMTTAVELLRCESGSLLLVDTETNELVFRVVVGPASARLQGTRLPPGVGVVGDVVKEGKPLIVNNAQSDPRHYKAIDDQVALQTSTLMAVPLVTKERVLGVLEVLNKTDRTPFNDDDCAALTALAIQSGIALENAQLYSDLKQAFTDTVSIITNAVEARDPYTAEHTDRVTMIALEMARELHWSREQIENLQIGALLHDIGKIGIADEILRKPDSLTPDEYKEMQQHPIVGAQMLKGVSALRPVLPYILYHQERYDGKGYPFGLAGDQIPIEGRLLTVADTFDAMTSTRPYRQALTSQEALAEIARHRGTQFDPEMMDALLGAYAHGRLKDALTSEV